MNRHRIIEGGVRLGGALQDADGRLRKIHAELERCRDLLGGGVGVNADFRQGADAAVSILLLRPCTISCEPFT